MRIGFIGLGGMGAPIAANLLRAGHEVAVWNRSPGKTDALAAAGASVAGSPRDAAEAGIVVTMLADDAALAAVSFGDDGILAAAARPLHLSLSTIGPATAEKLAAAHDGRFVAAPVFGRPAAAEAAKLFVVAAGPPAHVAACAPVFAAIAQRHFVVGEAPAMAAIVKLAGNFMILSTVEMLAEAMTLAEQHGVDRAALLEVLTGTIFGSPLVQNYGAMLVEERWRPAGFAAPLGLKDLDLAGAAAAAARVPMPLLSLVRDRLLATLAREGDDIDWAGIAKTVADQAPPR